MRLIRPLLIACGTVALATAARGTPTVATQPATRPEATPAVDWPPARLVERPVRTFAGNDFDAFIQYAPAEAANDEVWAFGEREAGGGTLVGVYVKAASPDGGPRTVPLVALDDPGVTGTAYAVLGTASWDGMGGRADLSDFAYLELTADDADGRRTVVRTTADGGPTRLLRGRSGPRAFALPVTDAAAKPARLRVALVLAGTGHVDVRDLRLVRYDPPAPGKAALITAGLFNNGLALAAGRSASVRTGKPISRVAVGNDGVAHVNVPSLTEVLVTGKGPGTTNLIVWDDAGASQSVDVRVVAAEPTTIPAAAMVPPARVVVSSDALADPTVRAAYDAVEAARVTFDHADAAAGLTDPTTTGAFAAYTAADTRLSAAVLRFEAARRAVPRPWWTPAGVVVTAVGLLGFVGFVGFAEPLVRRGRGRAAVLSALVLVAVVGQAYFGWGMAVAGRGEPWRAWAPLLGGAAVAFLVAGLALPRVNRRYRDAELRRMRALDAA